MLNPKPDAETGPSAAADNSHLLLVPLNAAVNLTGDQETKDAIANLTVVRRLKDDIVALTDAQDTEG